MAELVIVMGSTGSGKSYGIKYLDPKETIVINVNSSKRLPWEGSSKSYNEENINFFNLDTVPEIVTKLKQISSHAKNVKNVIIDDIRYVMEREYLKKALEQGYTKYTVMGKNFQELIDAAIDMRNDIVVFLNFHDEDITSSSTIIGKKIKLVGSLVEQHFNPLELVNIVLYAATEKTKDGVKHMLYTKAGSTHNGHEIPSKSPEGLFSEDTIDNNFQLISDLIRNYY